MDKLCTREVDYVHDGNVFMFLDFFEFMKLTRQVNVNLAKTCVELTNSGHTGVVKQKY